MPDEIFCSTAVRTRQTLSALDLPSTVPVHFTDALYLTEAPKMLRVLKQARGACVLLLGHNTGIAELAALLLDTPPAHDRFSDYPTGATLVCDFNTEGWNEIGWHQGQPISYIIPAELP